MVGHSQGGHSALAALALGVTCALARERGESLLPAVLLHALAICAAAYVALV